MSLSNNFIRNTHFVSGFSFKGKRTTDVGEDLLSATGITTETMDGAPVVFNGDMETVAVAGDGVKPDAILYSRISEELTDAEWMLDVDILRDEVKPGDPFTIVLAKPYGIIETNLTDASTFTVGDDVYVSGGVYSNTDPLTGTGVVVGNVIEVGTDKIKILLK